MSPAPLELELRDGLDESAVLALLGDGTRVQAGGARNDDRVLLDTFDGRLRAEGLHAEWPGRATATRRLILREAGRPPRSADVADGPVRLAALPAGPVRDRLAPVLDHRALLPVARVRSRTAPFAILDGDGKTVVRVTLERPVVVAGRRSLPLPARLIVEPLRGYEREYDAVLRRLRAAPGLRPAAEPLRDVAVSAAGGRAEGVSTKVRAPLEPGMRADAAAGMVLGLLADVAAANLPGVLDDLDTEFLHDLRVSIRRARSVLRELRGVHPADERSRLRTELRWAQALTSPVRDLDVQLLEWDDLAGGLGDDAGDLEPLRALLVHRRARELARLRRALRGHRFGAMLDAWRELAAAEPALSEEAPRAGVAIEVLAGDRIRSVYRRMVRDGRAIGADSPDTALHELRKRGKELRYLLELFGGLFPRTVVRPMVAALKDLQDVLGRFQDRSVQTALLRASVEELAARPGGPEAVLAAGRLIASLEDDQQRAREAFDERFRAFAAPEQRKLVRSTFAKAVEP